MDGVFEALPDAESAKSVNIQPVTFHPARIDEAVISQVKASVRQRILRAFVARAPAPSAQRPAPSAQRATSNEQRAASSSHGGGFSVDAGVRIEAAGRAGLERLLRYCARLPFAMDRLKQRGADLVYR
jgi:hypothetical protein